MCVLTLMKVDNRYVQSSSIDERESSNEAERSHSPAVISQPIQAVISKTGPHSSAVSPGAQRAERSRFQPHTLTPSPPSGAKTSTARPESMWPLYKKGRLITQAGSPAAEVAWSFVAFWGRYCDLTRCRK